MGEDIKAILSRFQVVREASYDKRGVPISISEEDFRAALAEAWDDSHEHCMGIGCMNPWRQD